MKKYLPIIFILFTFTVSAQTGADYCSQAKTKEFRLSKSLNKTAYPGDPSIDVTYYKLNMKVSVSPFNYLGGEVIVKAKPVGNSINSFFLDLKSNLNVSKVVQNSTNLSFNHSNNDQLFISLDKTYQPGEEFTVDITYGGVPEAGNGLISSASFSFYDSLANKIVISTLSEPYGAKDWWPTKDTPGDKADSSDVWITADSSFISVSNGKLIDVVNNGDGTKTYMWHNSYPIAGYLISMAITNYEIYDNTFHYNGQSMLVRNYNYPGRLTQARKNALDKTVDMLKIFSDKFGIYPFMKEKYANVEFAWGGGMEHQTATSLGGGAMGSENVIAHELAHQWFGDKVTCKDWHNIWLNEGFASYCECIYQEYEYGESAFKSYVDNFMNNQYYGAKTAVGTIYVDDITNELQIFNSARTYKKGAVVLHMLRGIVGDSTFFQILRQYLDDPQLSYNVATTEDFERVAENVSGKDLHYFFQEWIYGEGYPKYTFEWNYKTNSENNYTLILRATQKINSNPSFFTMPIQVRYTTTEGTFTTSVFNNQQDQEWEIPVTGQPLSVEVDPDNWILKDILGLTNITGNNKIISEYSLSQNYPNPFNPTTEIKYQISKLSKVQLKVFDALGKEIATLIDKFQQPGDYKINFSASDYNISSGIYFYRLNAGYFSETKKMIFLK